MANTRIYTKDNVKIHVSDFTDIAQTAMEKHQTSPYSSLILSTAIAVLGPLGMAKKYGRTVATIKSEGAAKNIVVESNTSGHVRALIGNPGIYTEYDKDIEKLNTVPLGIGVGTTGTLKVLNEVNANSFGGEVSLAKGDIVTDLAWYYDQSEQVRSAVVSNVALKDKTTLDRAFSATFQLLPGSTDEDIEWIENVVKNIKLKDFDSTEAWAEKLEANFLEEEFMIWKCQCSREKTRGALTSLTPADKKEIIAEQGKLEVVCNFCNTAYDFTEEFQNENKG